MLSYLFLRNKLPLLKNSQDEINKKRLKRNMEGDRIGLVLVRVSELRSKIINCIQNALATGDNEEAWKRVKDSKAAGPDAEDDYANEETDSLLNIRDALESLESRLVALQALQEKQVYDKESSLARIRLGQKMLLDKLKKYRGEELDVIQEAIAFAGETVEDNNDLLLPPYSRGPSGSMVSDEDYLSSLSYGRKTSPDGLKDEIGEEGGTQKSHDPRKPPSLSRVKAWIGTVAKAAITVVGVISVISLAGYEPRLSKRENGYKLFGGKQQEKNGNDVIECPPGQVRVVEENGDVRCLVKTRVLIPFVKLGPLDNDFGRG